MNKKIIGLMLIMLFALVFVGCASRQESTSVYRYLMYTGPIVEVNYFSNSGDVSIRTNSDNRVILYKPFDVIVFIDGENPSLFSNKFRGQLNEELLKSITNGNTYYLYVGDSSNYYLSDSKVLNWSNSLRLSSYDYQSFYYGATADAINK